MKKVIAAALAALISTNAVAFTGDGNENLEYARAFLDDKSDFFSGYWMGAVSGLSAVFSEDDYPYRICYSEDATAGQLSSIAARYLIRNPEQRHKSLNYIVWKAHKEAFGSGDQCL